MAVKKGALVIDTRMNYKKIDADFKNLEKQTKNLINKYNKSVDSIRSQELALEKVKNTLSEIENGDKIPTSVRKLESELKNINKELINYEKEFEKIQGKQQSLRFEVDTQNELGDLADANKIKIAEAEIQKLDNEVLMLADKEELAKQKAADLTLRLSNLRNNSIEAEDLRNKIELLNSKLSQTQEQANQAKEEISDMFNQKGNILGGSIDSIGNKIDKFKSRMTHLIGTVAFFNLFRSGLTKLRNSFISLLKTNDNFSNSLNQIKANLMTAFAPIYNACLPAINSLMNSLSKLTGTMATFIAGITGTSLSDATSQAKKLSGALDDASKSGEEASGSLAGFDKLEVISDNSSGDAGTGGGSGIDYSGEIQISEKLLNILNKIKNFVVENKDLFIGAIAGITAALISLKLLGLGPIKSLGIGLILGGLVILIQGIINFIKDPTWQNFATILAGIALVVGGIALLFQAWPVAIGAAIAFVVALIIRYWDEISAWLSSIGDWINDNVIKPVVNFFVGMWNDIVDGFKKGIEKIKEIVNKIIDFVKNNWQGLLLLLVNPFVGAFKLLYDNCEGFRNFIDNILEKIKTSFNNLKIKLKDIMTSIKDTMSNIWNSIWSTIKGVINKIIGGIETMINTIIKGLNKIIEPLTKVGNTILEAVGIKSFSFKTIPQVSLPRLATGAVIPPRQEFAAILGDQKHGTNIEAPLETIKQANREVMQEFIGMLAGLNSNEREIVFKNLTIVAQFGNKDFTKLVIDAVRLAEKELGKPLFVS